MLKLGRATKVKVLFLVLVFVFNFDLFKLPTAILEKGLFCGLSEENGISEGRFILGSLVSYKWG